MKIRYVAVATMMLVFGVALVAATAETHRIVMGSIRLPVLVVRTGIDR